MSSQITVYPPTRIFVQTRVNMVAAIYWFSHTTNDWIWLIGSFETIFQSISDRLQKREKEEKR